MTLYPVNLDLTGKLCLVIGGGRVALRKVCGLCKAAARVRVISPQLVPELQELADSGGIEWDKKSFTANDLQDAFLVFAATDSLVVQQQIQIEAQMLGILVNMASDPISGNFQVPAHFRQKDILITVSTGGKSPAIAARLRRFLQEQLDPAYADAVSFFGLLRTEVLADSNDPSSHSKLFSELLQKGVVEHILAAEWREVAFLLDSLLPESIDGYKLVETFRKAG